MRNVPLSIFVGLFSMIIAIGGGELFHGSAPLASSPPSEILGAGLSVALYLAVFQFFLAPRGSRSLVAKWPTMVAMAAFPLLLLPASMAGSGAGWWGAASMFVLICVGILLGAGAAGWVTLSEESLGTYRRLMAAGAVMLVAVDAAVAAGVIPPVRAYFSHMATPDQYVRVLWGIVGLNAALAVGLLVIRARAGGGHSLSQGSFGALALLAFVLACGLTPLVTFLGDGPTMHRAAILGVLCAAAQYAVMALLGTTGARLPSTVSAEP